MFSRLAIQTKFCLNPINRLGNVSMVQARLVSMDYFKNVPRYSVEEQKALRDKSHWNPPITPEFIEDDEKPTSSDLIIGQNYKSLEEALNLNIGPDMPTIKDDQNPQRDLVNFPRPKMPSLHPDLTRFYFVPDSWFQYFYPKTGVTGPYAFGAGLLTFLLSKEYLVIDHENVSGAYFIGLCVFVGTYFGPKLRKTNAEICDNEVNLWLNWQRSIMEFCQKVIEQEKLAQASAKNQSILFDAKRENIALQIEAEFRRRQMLAYREALKRLDYLIAKQNAEKQYKHQHMVNWIIESVRKSITPEQEKESLKNCISQLKSLSAKHQIATV